MSNQIWNATGYAANANFVPVLGQPVIDLLQPQPGERILDMGCGDGVLTEKLVALGGYVTGVDSSEDMVAAARNRGLDARLMDVIALTFVNEFDAVFTNAVLHWVKNHPDAAIASAYRALRSGGRFVGELGGHGCVAQSTWPFMPLSRAVDSIILNRSIPGISQPSMPIPNAYNEQDSKLRAYNSFHVRHRCRPECEVGWKLLPIRFALHCHKPNVQSFWMK